MIKVVFFICFTLNIISATLADTNITPIPNYYDYLSNYEHVYDGKLKSVTSANTVQMDDGNEYIITYIYVPENTSKKVTSQVKKLLFGKILTLHKYIDAKKDRYGRLPIVITYAAKGGDIASIQEDLISMKLVKLYIEDEGLDFIKYLKKIDNSTNQPPVSTNDAHKYIGDYAVFEGEITAFKETKKSVYLNFGKDWKTDFTLRFDKKYWQMVKDRYYVEKIDEIVGLTIRSRGFVENYYGPMINIDHAEQMDIIAE